MAVQIHGSGFSDATAVSFGTVNTSSSYVASSTLIEVDAPAHAAGTVDVTVTTPGGASAIVAADQFTYGTGQSPQLASAAKTVHVPKAGTTDPAPVGNAIPFQLQTAADSPSADSPGAARVSSDLAASLLAGLSPSSAGALSSGSFSSSPATLNAFRRDADAWVAGSSAPDSDFWMPLDRVIQPRWSHFSGPRPWEAG